MAKRNTICAGTDTSKDKLDVALDGSSEALQVKNNGGRPPGAGGARPAG